MSIDEVFLQKRKRWNKLIRARKSAEGVEIRCPKCHKIWTLEQLKKRNFVCSSCDHNLPMPPKERIELICDDKSFKEMFGQLQTENPLQFPGYDKKLEDAKQKTGQEEAFLAGQATIKNKKVAIGFLDGRFLMGSMGTVVGEKITRLCEYAGENKLPLIIYSASGGARMQEGLFSLMQMAKTAAAVERYKQNGGLFISCLTNPTTGGVSASYASLGDIIIAEPDALICFAGPRVIEQTIGQTLPSEFQHAEFLLEHGMIDLIATRKKQRKLLDQILRLHNYS